MSTAKEIFEKNRLRLLKQWAKAAQSLAAGQNALEEQAPVQSKGTAHKIFQLLRKQIKAGLHGKADLAPAILLKSDEFEDSLSILFNEHLPETDANFIVRFHKKTMTALQTMDGYDDKNHPVYWIAQAKIVAFERERKELSNRWIRLAKQAQQESAQDSHVISEEAYEEVLDLFFTGYAKNMVALDILNFEACNRNALNQIDDIQDPNRPAHWLAKTLGDLSENQILIQKPLSPFEPAQG